MSLFDRGIVQARDAELHTRLHPHHQATHTEETRHADHQKLRGDRDRAERLVHRSRLHRRSSRTAAPNRAQANLVHFTPGARTAWHTHPLGQTIYVTEGIGLCQREDGAIEVIRPGDRVFFEPGEKHWHGATPNRFMVHIAIQEADDSGSPVTWGEHVTDEEYQAAPML